MPTTCAYAIQQTNKKHYRNKHTQKMVSQITITEVSIMLRYLSLKNKSQREHFPLVKILQKIILFDFIFRCLAGTRKLQIGLRTQVKDWIKTPMNKIIYSHKQAKKKQEEHMYLEASTHTHPCVCVCTSNGNASSLRGQLRASIIGLVGSLGKYCFLYNILFVFLLYYFTLLDDLNLHKKKSH